MLCSAEYVIVKKSQIRTPGSDPQNWISNTRRNGDVVIVLRRRRGVVSTGISLQARNSLSDSDVAVVRWTTTSFRWRGGVTLKFDVLAGIICLNGNNNLIMIMMITLIKVL